MKENFKCAVSMNGYWPLEFAKFQVTRQNRTKNIKWISHRLIRCFYINSFNCLLKSFESFYYFHFFCSKFVPSFCYCWSGNKQSRREKKDWLKIMDVYNMYIGDASSYRSNMFRDYEKHPYGTFEGKCQQPQQQRKSYYTMVQGISFKRIFDIQQTQC